MSHPKSFDRSVESEFGKNLDREDIEEKMSMLTGKVYNVPPEISAVRVQVRTRKISKFENLILPL